MQITLLPATSLQNVALVLINCPWQKGTNENTNGLLREFYPKGMDLSEIDQTDLKNVINMLNDRPRKCINYKTPKEDLFG